MYLKMADKADKVCVANELEFEEFCQLCEELHANKKNRARQDAILTEYVDTFRRRVVQTVGTDRDSSFFPVLRLLLSKLDRCRPPYELKEDKLGKLYVKVLSLHHKSRDAEKLLNFRTARGNQHGSDFASITCSVLQAGVIRTGDCTIGQINEYLDRIANAETGSKAYTNYEVLTDVMCNTSPLQHKWFVRVLLKDMKLEMGQSRLLACFHPDAPELFNLCQDLVKICTELEQGASRPGDLGVEVLSAVSPMLAERLDVTNIHSLSNTATYYIENKFDGERFQMHMRDGEFEYFSRRGHSYGEHYGRGYSSPGALTPRLEHCFDPAVTSFILDGEMMGWHKENKCFGSKGMAFDVKKITLNSKFDACFCPFDILYYNGRSLVGTGDEALPLCKRLSLLDMLFSDVPGTILHSKREVVKEREDILVALNKAIEEGEEGVIVKDANSYYIANQRSAGWYKVKPEYTGGAMVDLDLAVLGADYAQNSAASGLVKSFFLALAVPPDTPGEMPSKWLSFGRVATGISLQERQELCEQMGQHWTKSASSCLQFGKEKPQLWIPPDHAVVLQVKASELIRTTHYAAGYTLRFPRITSIRHDKSVRDAMTTDDLRKLVQGRSVEKLTRRQISSSELTTESRQTRKRKIPPVEVAAAFRPALAPPTVPAQEGGSTGGGGALAGRKLTVLSGDELSSKQQLETMVLSHGGLPVQNIGPDTWLCIAGKRTQRVQNAVASSSDVVSAEWLRGLQPGVASGFPTPLHFQSMRQSTRMKLAKDFDDFGDSYTEEINEDKLRVLLDNMAEVDQIYPTTDEKLRLDTELFGYASPYSCLRGCHIYIDRDSVRLQLVAASMGARVTCESAPDLTHLILSERAGDNEVINSLNVAVVTEGWLDKCLESRRRVDLSPYTVEPR